MPIATSVQEYLDRKHVKYDVLVHAPTHNAAHNAELAHVSGDHLAKAVVLEDDNGYLMAVLPASHKLDLQALGRELHRDGLTLAAERELATLFKDCEQGAIPPLGPLYNMETILDRSLADAREIYFEAGDHLTLICLKGENFQQLMDNVPQRSISHHL
jgi:Ala-tRNA(Pro) deacylase